MSMKLDFTEVDLLNATWSGMKAVSGKAKKDATDLNSLSKGTSAITNFLEMKISWVKYTDKNPKAKDVLPLFLK